MIDKSITFETPSWGDWSNPHSVTWPREGYQYDGFEGHGWGIEMQVLRQTEPPWV